MTVRLLFAMVLISSLMSPPAAQAAGAPRIAFSYESANFKPKGVFVMRADGGGRRRVASGRANQVQWSPDRKWIAFSLQKCATREDCDAYIDVVRPDGSGLKRFAGGADTIESFDWSPDSSQIVYSAFDFDDGEYDIRVATEGKRATTALTDTPDSYELDPDWSPDGSRIVFSRQGEDVQDVFSISADGSDERNLTNDEAVELSPRWSPDGSMIAYATTRDEKPSDEGPYTSQLYVMQGDGTEHTRISTEKYTRKREPQWSRDSSRIAWHEECDDDVCAYDLEIWVGRPDGTGVRQVTDSKRLQEQSPQWSPDGRRLLFLRWTNNSSRTELVSIGVSGEGRKILTDSPGPEGSFSWQAW